MSVVNCTAAVKNTLLSAQSLYPLLFTALNGETIVRPDGTTERGAAEEQLLSRSRNARLQRVILDIALCGESGLVLAPPPLAVAEATSDPVYVPAAAMREQMTQVSLYFTGGSGFDGMRTLAATISRRRFATLWDSLGRVSGIVCGSGRADVDERQRMREVLLHRLDIEPCRAVAMFLIELVVFIVRDHYRTLRKKGGDGPFGDHASLLSFFWPELLDFIIASLRPEAGNASPAALPRRAMALLLAEGVCSAVCDSLTHAIAASSHGHQQLHEAGGGGIRSSVRPGAGPGLRRRPKIHPAGPGSKLRRIARAAGGAASPASQDAFLSLRQLIEFFEALLAQVFTELEADPSTRSITQKYSLAVLKPFLSLLPLLAQRHKNASGSKKHPGLWAAILPFLQQLCQYYLDRGLAALFRWISAPGASEEEALLAIAAIESFCEALPCHGKACSPVAGHLLSAPSVQLVIARVVREMISILMANNPHYSIGSSSGGDSSASMIVRAAISDAISFIIIKKRDIIFFHPMDIMTTGGCGDEAVRLILQVSLYLLSEDASLLTPEVNLSTGDLLAASDGNDGEAPLIIGTKAGSGPGGGRLYAEATTCGCGHSLLSALVEACQGSPKTTDASTSAPSKHYMKLIIDGIFCSVALGPTVPYVPATSVPQSPLTRDYPTPHPALPSNMAKALLLAIATSVPFYHAFYRKGRLPVGGEAQRPHRRQGRASRSYVEFLLHLCFAYVRADTAAHDQPLVRLLALQLLRVAHQHLGPEILSFSPFIIEVLLDIVSDISAQPLPLITSALRALSLIIGGDGQQLGRICRSIGGQQLLQQLAASLITLLRPAGDGTNLAVQAPFVLEAAVSVLHQLCRAITLGSIHEAENDAISTLRVFLTQSTPELLDLIRAVLECTGDESRVRSGHQHIVPLLRARCMELVSPLGSFLPFSQYAPRYSEQFAAIAKSFIATSGAASGTPCFHLSSYLAFYGSLFLSARRALQGAAMDASDDGQAARATATGYLQQAFELVTFIEGSLMWLPRPNGSNGAGDSGIIACLSALQEKASDGSDSEDEAGAGGERARISTGESYYGFQHIGAAGITKNNIHNYLIMNGDAPPSNNENSRATLDGVQGLTAIIEALGVYYAPHVAQTAQLLIAMLSTYSSNNTDPGSGGEEDGSVALSMDAMIVMACLRALLLLVRVAWRCICLTDAASAASAFDLFLRQSLFAGDSLTPTISAPQGHALLRIAISLSRLYLLYSVHKEGIVIPLLQLLSHAINDIGRPAVDAWCEPLHLSHSAEGEDNESIIIGNHNEVAPPGGLVIATMAHDVAILLRGEAVSSLPFDSDNDSNDNDDLAYPGAGDSDGGLCYSAATSRQYDEEYLRNLFSNMTFLERRGDSDAQLLEALSALLTTVANVTKSSFLALFEGSGLRILIDGIITRYIHPILPPGGSDPPTGHLKDDSDELAIIIGLLAALLNAIGDASADGACGSTAAFFDYSDERSERDACAHLHEPLIGGYSNDLLSFPVPAGSLHQTTVSYFDHYFAMARSIMNHQVGLLLEDAESSAVDAVLIGNTCYLMRVLLERCTRGLGTGEDGTAFLRLIMFRYIPTIVMCSGCQTAQDELISVFLRNSTGTDAVPQAITVRAADHQLVLGQSAAPAVRGAAAGAGVGPLALVPAVADNAVSLASSIVRLYWAQLASTPQLDELLPALFLYYPMKSDDNENKNAAVTLGFFFTRVVAAGPNAVLPPGSPAELAMVASTIRILRCLQGASKDNPGTEAAAGGSTYYYHCLRATITALPVSVRSRLYNQYPGLAAAVSLDA